MFWTFTNVIEILGLTLAFLDFFGLGPVLERKIAKFRAFYLDQFMPGVTGLFGALSGRLMVPSLVVIALLFISIGLILAIEGPSSPRLDYLWTVLIALIYVFLIFIIAPLLFVMFILGPLSELLNLMDKAPNGSVGTVGLLLALSGFLLERI